MRGLLLFDIDGVIRDVSGSYRLAIQETVNQFTGWRPTIEHIDSLKSEGTWNNDWSASLELIKRHALKEDRTGDLPNFQTLIEVFNGFYFGGNPNDIDPNWNGFIRNEPLLVNHDFFNQLSLQGFKWGFVSGSEASSARFLLETRLGLTKPPLIAMGDAPEKPDPTGLIQLAKKLIGGSLGFRNPPIAYLGDTVADVLTVQKAREKEPEQDFNSFAIAPPHLHRQTNKAFRLEYEEKLRSAGADKILQSMSDIFEITKDWPS